MAVLKSVTGKWRLFWVLEAVGLSFFLAMLALKATGNEQRITEKDVEDRADGNFDCAGYTIFYFYNFGNCNVYTWTFIIYLHPIAVTASSFLATSAVSSPRESSIAAKICLTIKCTVYLVLVGWLFQTSLGIFLSGLW